MTVTALHPAIHVLDLDAGVRATAVLPGFVGMMTAGPAKLAIVPIAGGGGPVIDLAVESPQELALLSKDVAVVRSADGSLWAIGDLGGTPRARLVARDVRTIVMRPHGESALALLQDGSAGAITLSKQEVSMRPFAVRGGALRACSIGDNVTYVVVEGDGGGQLRIHPGATPELGTSAKTTLPIEAKDFDQVRGGASLSVVFRRGMSGICVITGSPNKLAPKMIELYGKPADLAVLDDALFVAFADGRIALYDGAAIANAGSAIHATATLTPSTRGKPRLAALAVPSKGAPSLWIGTTSGEILSATLARDGEKVEEAPPPKSLAPREDLRADLAAAKLALADAEAARDAEIERARALEESQAATLLAHEAARAAHAAAIEALTTRTAAAIDALKGEHANLLDAEKAEHANLLEAERSAHAGAIEALKTEQGHLLDGQKAEYASSVEALKAEHANLLDAQKAEYASSVEALKAEHANLLDAQKAGYVSSVEALKAENANLLDAVKADCTASIEAQKAEHATSIEAHKAEHAGAIEALKAEHAAQIDAQKAAHAGALDALKAEHAAHLEAQKAERAQAIDALATQHSSAIEALKAEHANQLDARKAEHAASSDALTGEHAKAIEALKADHAAVVASKDDAHARVLAEKEAVWSTTQHDLEAAVAAAASVHDGLRNERESLQGEVTSLASRVRAAEQLAAEKSRAHAEIAAELSEARAEIAAQRALLEKDFLKWGEVTIPLDRARGTLDTMIARAREVLGKRRGE